MATIHLQSIGERNAIPAKELKAGMVRICNFGIENPILSAELTPNGKSVKVVFLGSDGKQYPKTMRATTLVAVKGV